MEKEQLYTTGLTALNGVLSLLMLWMNRKEAEALVGEVYRKMVDEGRPPTQEENDSIVSRLVERSKLISEA